MRWYNVKFSIHQWWENGYSEELDYFDQFPSKISSRRAVRDYWEHWGDWSRELNYLDRVKLHKWIGKPVDELVSHYIHRLRPGVAGSSWLSQNRVQFLLHRIFDIQPVYRDCGGELRIRTRYSYHEAKTIKESLKGKYSRKEIYYIVPETGLLDMQKKKVTSKSARQRAEERREYAEKEKSLKKIGRLSKKQRQLKQDEQFWQEVMKRKQQQEKKISEQKMTSKGFDPKTSFRNVPLT